MLKNMTIIPLRKTKKLLSATRLSLFAYLLSQADVRRGILRCLLST